MYYGARYYDPVLARFITADTVYDKGPQGLNRYSYALNNPIKYNDPTGHFAFYNPAYPIVKGIQQTGEAIVEVVDAAGEFVVEHGDSIGNGLEQAEMAMEIAGAGMITHGGGKAAAGLTTTAVGATATATGVGAPGGVPVATAGGVITVAGTAEMAAGAVLMVGGKIVGHIGRRLKEAKEEKDSNGRANSNPEKGRFDTEHSGSQGYDDALENARQNAGDLGGDTKKMYDPETGTLIGEKSADGTQGWRIDDDHVNWWNWSEGKKGSGGQYGHEWYPPEQSGPHSKHIGYAEWE